MNCERCGGMTPITENTAEGLCPRCIDKKVSELKTEVFYLKQERDVLMEKCEEQAATIAMLKNAKLSIEKVICDKKVAQIEQIVSTPNGIRIYATL